MIKDRQIKQRQKYVEKTIKDFINKGWDTSKLSKGFHKNTVTTEQGYTKYKELVKRERAYYKEREQIARDMAKYRQKIAKNQETSLKQKLANIYGKGTKEIKRIWSDRKLLKLSWKDNKETIQDKVVSKFNTDFTDQLSYFDKKGEEKQIGGLFKYHKDDRGVMLNLKELNDLMRKDKKAVTHASMLIDYVYEKLIPLYYEGTNEMPPIYGKDKKAPDKFFVEVSKKMLDYYKNELL